MEVKGNTFLVELKVPVFNKTSKNIIIRDVLMSKISRSGEELKHFFSCLCYLLELSTGIISSFVWVKMEVAPVGLPEVGHRWNFACIQSQVVEKLCERSEISGRQFLIILLFV